MGQMENVTSAMTIDGAGDAARTGWPCNIYRDVFGAWRWEFRGVHNEMFDSLDRFDTYQDCVGAAQRVGLTPQT